MKRLYFKMTKSSLVCLLAVFLGWSGLVAAQAAEIHKTLTKTDNVEPVPMVIKSNTLEVNDALRIVTFTGEVDARKDDFTILCNKMLVYYERLPGQKEGEQGGTKKLPGQKEGEQGGTKIDKIVASGEVRISRAEGGVATAEEAVYYQLDDKLVLTGRPVVKQGNDFVEGDRITIFLKENRSVVESAKDHKVKATIFPRTVQKAQ
jgi:lipopolysaccharide export system protein LptA